MISDSHLTQFLCHVVASILSASACVCESQGSGAGSISLKYGNVVIDAQPGA